MELKEYISKDKKQIINNTSNYLLLLLFSFSVDYFLNASIGLHSIVFFFMLVIVLSFSKRLFYLSIMVSGLITALYIPISLQYGPPSFSMSVAMFYTYETEAWSFISGLPLEYLFLFLFFALFSLFVANRKYLPITGNFRVCLISVVLLYAFIPPSYALIKEGRKKTALSSFVYYGPVEFVFDNIRYYVQVKGEDDIIKDILSKKDSWQIEAVDNKKDLQIVVIGESVRRDFMNAFGFEINNTPFMSSSNGVLFENFVSASSSTVPSLVRMLSQNNHHSYAIENNLVTLAKKAGLYTHWFSNQGYIGLYSTPIACVGRLADDVKFIVNEETESGGESDFDLMPWVEKAIAENNKGKQLIVIHLIGSHAPFCSSTDGKFDSFLMTDEISCYIQTIKNTDKLLENIYSSALASKKTFNMLYFSDHGLNFTKKKALVHGGEYKQNYDVPLFIWSDDAVSLDTITAARSGMDFIKLFTELSGIKLSGLEQNYRFISNDTAPKIVVLNNEDNLCFYDKLKDNKIPTTHKLK